MATLPLEHIIRDQSIQQRHGGIKQARVREYASAMRREAPFPPVIVYRNGETYYLADGFHRCAAAEAIGRSEIEVEIKEGTHRDACLYAAGANASHGLRRTNLDKRKAVLTLLQDEEWSRWSDREIARRTSTSQWCAAG